MKTKPISSREKLLMVFLVFAVLGVTYLFLRIKPIQKDVTILEDQLKSATKKLSKIKLAKPSKLPSVSTLKNQKIEIQEKLERERKTLEGYRQAFIDLNVNDSIASLSGQITRLAVQNQLQVLEKHEEQQGLDALTGVKTSIHDQEIRRPMFVLKVLGDFRSLNQFIIDLSNLSYSVVITRLDFTAERAPNGIHYVLRSSITLAL